MLQRRHSQTKHINCRGVVWGSEGGSCPRCKNLRAPWQWPQWQLGCLHPTPALSMAQSSGVGGGGSWAWWQCKHLCDVLLPALLPELMQGEQLSPVVVQMLPVLPPRSGCRHRGGAGSRAPWPRLPMPHPRQQAPGTEHHCLTVMLSSPCQSYHIGALFTIQNQDGGSICHVSNFKCFVRALLLSWHLEESQ